MTNKKKSDQLPGDHNAQPKPGRGKGGSLADEDLGGEDFSDFFTEEDPKAVGRKLDTMQLIGDLSHRERAILYLYACGDTQTEIGEKVGLSQRHVGRILEGIAKKAINRGLDKGAVGTIRYEL